MSELIKILLVDDLPQNLEVLKALLERPGLEFLTATSGERALQLLRMQAGEGTAMRAQPRSSALDAAPGDTDDPIAIAPQPSTAQAGDTWSSGAERANPSATDKTLSKVPVALALLDVHMPAMDGFELAEAMRDQPQTRHIPIIFLTGTDRTMMRTFRGYEAGAVDVLYKPFDPHILRSKVEMFVELYAQQQQQLERMRMMEDALHTNELFIAVLGHDLRNPLTSVLGLAELIALTAEEPRVRSIGTRIAQSSGRMARLIDQMLDVALMRAGRAQLQPGPGDLHSLCHQLSEEFALAADEGRIMIETAGNSRGHWDLDRLSQVFSNLIANALQHGGQDPVRVHIEGRKIRHVTVTVTNSGTIPDDVARTMFEPFSRDVSSAHRKGLGLGLYIVREHVTAHGGTISVQCHDNYTEFVIRLPRQCPLVPPVSRTHAEQK